MNYGLLREDFLDILNRTDCKPEHADRFISKALRRVERTLRTPLQLLSVELEVESDTFSDEVPIPTNMLAVDHLAIDGEPLRKLTPEQFDSGYRGYKIASGYFVLSGVGSPDVVEVNYFTEFPQNPSDEGVTTYSAVLPDVVVYCALVYAADTYLDERKSSFEQSYQTLLNEVQGMADRDAMTGNLQITAIGQGVI